MATRPHSLWHDTYPIKRFAPLTSGLTVDVAVIGGGITGVTTALLLAQQGRSVALIEQQHLGMGETGRTTSHLTEAVDARYQHLARNFGQQGALLVARSSREAIATIEQFVTDLAIECGFERVPGYLYSERNDDVRGLAKELDAAVQAGSVVQWSDHVPLPFPTAGGICWPQQAQLHATQYLAGLIKEAERRGVRIFEETAATNVHDGEPCLVHTDRGDLQAGAVVVAANVPVNNRVLLHTKIAAYRSYVIAAEWNQPLRGLFWDVDDPYHYTRTHTVNGRSYLLVGGEDHRTGVERDTEGCYQALERYATDRFGALSIAYRWSGQIIEPVDGLPFIGLNAGSDHVYVATGYSGNGMTFGTLAGMVISDAIAGRDNPYSTLYDATRVKPLAGALDYVAENALFPAHLIADRLTSLDAEKRSPEELAAGDGGVFSSEQGKLAICRDRLGQLHACSAVCTHLGCDVGWNRAEQTWDCPCHGSRFTSEGTVINGPAISDLPQARVPTPR